MESQFVFVVHIVSLGGSLETHAMSTQRADITAGPAVVAAQQTAGAATGAAIVVVGARDGRTRATAGLGKVWE